jgi:hypothetical protein
LYRFVINCTKDFTSKEGQIVNFALDEKRMKAEDKTDKKINFESLDKYELTQENYIKDVEPNTYATVRGENLINFLEALYNVLVTHAHNPLKPYARINYYSHDVLVKLFNNLKNDILNNSIRIN